MKNPKLYFEDYARIFADLDTGLAEHLNKVLSIHGLLQQRNKADCLKVLKFVEMMDPNRSTLSFRDSVYPCAPLCLDDVLAAFKALEWSECPLGSILVVGTAIGKENLDDFSRLIGEVSTTGSAKQKNPNRSIPSTIAESSAIAVTAASLKKPKRQGKRKLNPSRSIPVHTKSMKNLICSVPSIGTVGSESCHPGKDNLSPQILAVIAERKKSFYQQERWNRMLLAEVEQSLNTT